MRTTTAALIAATFLSIAAPAVAQEVPDLDDPTATPCPAGSAHDSGDGYCVLDCPVAPSAPIVVREWFTDGTYLDTPGECPTEPVEAEVLSGTARPTSTPSATPVATTTAPAAQVATVSPAFTG